MHDLVCYNLEILPSEKVFLAATSNALFYGKSVFTTLTIHRKKPFLLEKHLSRLFLHANKLNIETSHLKKELIENSLLRLVVENKVENARCRITFFEESSRGLWQNKTEKLPSFLITTADLTPRPNFLSLEVSPFPVNSSSPLQNIKSGNYLENLLSFDFARQNGFDEAVRLNEKKQIVSASLANIFWVKDEKIFTPSLKSGCLAGITREWILENFEVFELETEIPTLQKADEIFLSSSGIGIVSASLNLRTTSATITDLIREKYEKTKKLLTS